MHLIDSIIAIVVASSINITSIINPDAIKTSPDTDVQITQLSDLSLCINSQKPVCDIKTILINNKAFIPARGIFETLGYNVQWKPSEKTVLLKNTENALQLEINKPIAVFNQKALQLDTPPVIYKNLTYIPLRFACEVLGMEVTWSENSKTIDIVSKKNIKYETAEIPTGLNKDDDTKDKLQSQNNSDNKQTTSERPYEKEPTVQSDKVEPSITTQPTPSISDAYSSDILAPASATVDQAIAWAKDKGATETFISLAPLYWELCPPLGIDPVVAYAQSAKETGYGRFSGIVDEDFHNPCGLKNTYGGGDKSKNAHMRFDDWKTGVIAHIDHLALYAGVKGYPKESTPDPRHFPYLFGIASTIEELGNKWATSSNYSRDLLNNFIAPLRKTEVQ